MPAKQVMQKAGISFRAVVPEDRDLLYRIYASTREYEMNLVPEWPEELKQQFLLQQFTAQDTYYHQVNPAADYLVILINGESAGRLYLSKSPTQIHIIDISLLPQFRNLGIGSNILQGIINEAGEHQQTVTIEVEKFNPALRLYSRLGFITTNDTQPIYMSMTWTPQPLEHV